MRTLLSVVSAYVCLASARHHLSPYSNTAAAAVTSVSHPNTRFPHQQPLLHSQQLQHSRLGPETLIRPAATAYHAWPAAEGDGNGLHFRRQLIARDLAGNLFQVYLQYVQ
jgi:hypothetical protein